MVRIIFIIICLVPFTLCAADKPMTGDDLQRLLNRAESEHRQHEKELKSNEIHKIFEPVEKEIEIANSSTTTDDRDELPKPVEAKNNEKYDFFSDKDKQQQEKKEPQVNSGAGKKTDKHSYDKNDLPPAIQTYSNSNINKKGNTKNKKKSPSQKQTADNKDSDRYIPPSWRNISNKKTAPIVAKTVSRKKRGPTFGIWLGTEFRAKLIRSTTNVEPSLAEFVVVDDVYGNYKMLPKNTKLFARKALSTSSNRLYFSCVKGITPDGTEFDLSATVTDISVNKMAGLSGAITTDKKMIKRSIASGVLAASGEVVNQATGSGVAGTAVSSAAKTALSEKKAETDASLGEAEFVIFVSPQEVYIRVDETF